MLFAFSPLMLIYDKLLVFLTDAYRYSSTYRYSSRIMLRIANLVASARSESFLLTNALNFPTVET